MPLGSNKCGMKTTAVHCLSSESLLPLKISSLFSLNLSNFFLGYLNQGEENPILILHDVKLPFIFPEYSSQFHCVTSATSFVGEGRELSLLFQCHSQSSKLLLSHPSSFF